MARFVRWESDVPNGRGAHIGVFGLANGLAHDGRLDPDELAWWRAANDRGDAAYIDPATADPTLFDRSVHPITSCWFRVEARHLFGDLPGYLDLLDRHGVGWRRAESDAPGRVLYADDVQVVVVPGPDATLSTSTSRALPRLRSTGATTSLLTRHELRSAASVDELLEDVDREH